MPRYLYEFHPVHERRLDPRNHRSHHHLCSTTLHRPRRSHHLRLPSTLPQHQSISDPAMTCSPMNREVNDLVLVFSSAFVGAIIAFLAVLVTFTFYHEIREVLLFQRLIVSINEPRPPNAAARPHQEPEQPRENEEGGQRCPPFLLFATHGNRLRLPMVRLPPDCQNNPNRHLWIEDFPAAFAAWRNRNHDPWAEPPD